MRNIQTFASSTWKKQQSEISSSRISSMNDFISTMLKFFDFFLFYFPIVLVILFPPFSFIQCASPWNLNVHEDSNSSNHNLEQLSNDRRKTKTKAITPTNHNRNKQRHEPITIPSNFLSLARSALRKNHVYKVGLVLVLLLIGWKTGASLSSQSLSVAIAIT